MDLIQKKFLNKSIFKFYLPAFGVFEREVRRFFSVPTQTILAPMGSALIYFALFGLALGKLIQRGDNSSFTHGLPYIVFLVPGIMAMETLNAAFQNPVSSIMISKWTGTIVDILMSPVTDFGVWCAYVAGALVRSLIVGMSVFIAGCICSEQFIHANWFLLFAAIVINTGMFAGFSVVAGSVVKSWEQFSIISSFILQPLTFFSGVFFSFGLFPPWVQVLKYFNPVFYIVSMFRIAVVGQADTSAVVSFGMSSAFALLAFLMALFFLRKGFGLRN